MCGDEEVGKVDSHRERADCSGPVFPVGEVDGKAEQIEDDLLCAPCAGEEEEALVPACLPTVYQPTHSEYLDHCVTHYPFRAWCKHCLEGRGREFGHEAHRGDKDSRAMPVISFDYAFISDRGEVKNQEEYIAAGEGAAKVLVMRTAVRVRFSSRSSSHPSA